jgi:predicted KAP-like P-loop ATPase
LRRALSIVKFGYIEQTEKDIESSAQHVQEAKNSVAVIVKEIKALAKEQETQQVRVIGLD